MYFPLNQCVVFSGTQLVRRRDVDLYVGTLRRSPGSYTCSSDNSDLHLPLPPHELKTDILTSPLIRYTN